MKFFTDSEDKSGRNQNPMSKKMISGDEHKPETYNEGMASEEPVSNQSTSEKVTGDITKAIAVMEGSRTVNPLDKLNTIDKSNLENLQK